MKRSYREPSRGTQSSDGRHNHDSHRHERRRGSPVSGRHHRGTSADRRGRSAPGSGHSSTSPSYRHNKRSDGGHNTARHHRKSLSERMTGKHESKKRTRRHASKSGRAHRRSDSGTSSDDESLLSQPVSHSDTDSGTLPARSGPFKVESGKSTVPEKGRAKKGSKSAQKVVTNGEKPSKARQPEESREQLDTEQHRKRHTRSKTKGRSRDGHRAKHAVAESFNPQWPTDNRLAFDAEHGYKESEQVNTCRESPPCSGIGVAENAWQHSNAGEQNDIAGSIAGRRYRTVSGACDSEAGGLNGVVID